jgi:hypothetical protein
MVERVTRSLSIRALKYFDRRDFSGFEEQL